MLEVNEFCYLSCLTKFLSSLFHNFYLKCKDTKLHQFYTNFPFPYPSKLFESQSRSSHQEVFLGKGVLKICSKCTGVNLLHIFRIPFVKNTSGRLLPPKTFLRFQKVYKWGIGGKKVIFGKHNLHRQKRYKKEIYQRCIVPEIFFMQQI